MSLTEAQKLLRREGIGASESPMILGESPFGGPIDLYLRKLGLADEIETTAQKVGNVLEAGIATLYEQETSSVCTESTTLRHPDLPWYLATPDRWVNGRAKLLQIKVVGHWMAHHWSDAEDGYPDYVRIQVTQEMDVAGAEYCDIAALIDGTDFRIYQVPFDPELAAGIRESVRSFWFDHIVPRIPPHVDGTKSADALLRALYPKHRAPMMTATLDAERWAQELRTAKGSLARWTAVESKAEQEIKKLLGDAEGMRGEDWHCTWKTSARGVRTFLFNDYTAEKKGRKAA